MIKVAVVFGTRPETIKLAPVIRALRACPGQFQSVVCATAQHREMLDQALAAFDLTPDYDLDIMSPAQSLSGVAARVLERVDQVLLREQPDWVLVQGDTTTAMAAGLAAYYRHIKVGHVEAGLRSGDRHNPFPEEINRRVADVVADLHFAPTEAARQSLLREGTETQHIVVTGNTVVDALLDVASRPYEPGNDSLRQIWRSSRRIVLFTAHRRESFGQPLQNMLLALRDLAERFRDEALMVWPVHLNPSVGIPAREILGSIGNVALLEPLDYVSFVHLMKRSCLILSDSGGIQEEAPSLGKPVLVMRSVTERTEGTAAGTTLLVGTGREAIVEAASRLLTDEGAYQRMASATNPYGDGRASERILRAIASFS